jgi:hypothetical protein
VNIKDIKQQIEFLQDAILQKGYDLGYEAVLEMIELEADNLHNASKLAEAENMRAFARKVRTGNA